MYFDMHCLQVVMAMNEVITLSGHKWNKQHIKYVKLEVNASVFLLYVGFLFIGLNMYAFLKKNWLFWDDS